MNIKTVIELILKSKKFRDQDIEQLILCYGEQFRQYHTLDHIADLLNHLTQLKYSILFEKNDFELLILAIIFHDVEYTVGCQTNEIDSVRFFQNAAKYSNLSKLEIDAISNLILVTKDHRPYNFNYPEYDLQKLSEIMIKLDLKGFEVDDFLRYELLVQKEFSIKYNWDEYKTSHIKFLEAYKDRVNEKAQENMNYLIEYCKNSNDYTFVK